MVHELHRYLEWRRLSEEFPDHRFHAAMAPARRAVLIYEEIWPGLRWFAEAAALADLAPEKIARRIGVARQVEWLFERGCFDVRDRLDRPELVLHVIIGVHRVWQGDWDWPDIGWKVLAYVHGPSALDHLSPAWGVSRSQPWRGVDQIPGDAADLATLTAALHTMLGDSDAEHLRKALDLQGRLEKVATGLDRWPRSEQQAQPWRRSPAASQAGVAQAQVRRPADLRQGAIRALAGWKARGMPPAGNRLPARVERTRRGSSAP